MVWGGGRGGLRGACIQLGVGADLLEIPHRDGAQVEGKFLLFSATRGALQFPPRPLPALKASDRARTPSACLCPPGFAGLSEACTRPGRFVEILRLNVR